MHVNFPLHAITDKFDANSLPKLQIRPDRIGNL